MPEYTEDAYTKSPREDFSPCWLGKNGRVLFQPHSYNLGHKGWKFPHFSHFAAPQPCAMLTKHFDLTQVCIWLFSNIERGNGGAGTYSIGITVMSSCFCHFSTQFVRGCSSSTIPRIRVWSILDELHRLWASGLENSESYSNAFVLLPYQM